MADRPPAKRATNRPGNPNGSVLIVEYHKIAKQEARWDRSVERFKKDLERLYAMGFRPVTVSEYVENRMSLPPGASPVAITFDDGHPSQFRYGDDGRLDPDCAVAIWQKFAEKHPDFPVKATFFMLPPVPFGQKATLQQKLSQLKRWGCELGSHTLSHANLGKLSDAKVRDELEGSADWIRKQGFEPKSLALPYGVRPKNRDLLKTYSSALLVGASPAPAPTAKGMDPHALPRVQGIEGPNGLTDWLDKIEAGKTEVYVQP